MVEKANNWLQCKKLDRIMINEKWIEHIGYSTAAFLGLGLSDNSPVILQLKALPNLGLEPFRFFNRWCANEAFVPVVRKICQGNISTDSMEDFYAKLLKAK